MRMEILNLCRVIKMWMKKIVFYDDCNQGLGLEIGIWERDQKFASKEWDLWIEIQDWG